MAAKADDSAISAVGKSNNYGDLDNLPPLGQAAALDKASTAQVCAAAGDTVLTADRIGDASALVSLTDAGTIPVDWSGFVVGEVVLGGNRALGNPSAIVPGTTRYLFVRTTSGTRTLTFGSNFKGALPTINDVTSSKWYLLALVAYSTTHVVVSSMRAL